MDERGGDYEGIKSRWGVPGGTKNMKRGNVVFFVGGHTAINAPR